MLLTPEQLAKHVGRALKPDEAQATLALLKPYAEAAAKRVNATQAAVRQHLDLTNRLRRLLDPRSFGGDEERWDDLITAAVEAVRQGAYTTGPVKLEDLKVDRVFAARRPRIVNFLDHLDDRHVLWISADRTLVQYDSPTVGPGRHYPKVTTVAFLRWAYCDVTDKMPAGGGWRKGV